MARHLDPFSQTIRAIRSSSKATEADRRAAIRYLLEMRRTTTLSTGQASIACRGVIATLEALETEALLHTVEPGSGRHKNLVLIHAKHLDEMNKSFALVSKHMATKNGEGKRGRGQKGSLVTPPKDSPREPAQDSVP